MKVNNPVFSEIGNNYAAPLSMLTWRTGNFFVSDPDDAVKSDFISSRTQDLFKNNFQHHFFLWLVNSLNLYSPYHRT